VQFKNRPDLPRGRPIVWTEAAVLACALTMLGRSEHRLPPINLVDTAPLGASRNVEAYVTGDAPAINLLTSSPAFREVARSPRKCTPRAAVAKVASVLVHEEWHLRHGPDERSAYSAQLTALVALGFNEQTMLYWGVKRSMLARLRYPQ
jgi:hypothetical protein